MELKINFPKIENEDVGLCFVRKSRQNQRTSYHFYKGNISKKISDELKKWLIENLNSLKKTELKPYNPNNYRDAEHLDLDKIDTWAHFKKSAFDLAHQEITGLDTIKHNLIAFIIYIKLKDTIIGQVRKVTSSSLLDKKGLYTLFFDDSAFNELKEQKGIEIDKYADLIFKFTSQSSEGAILHKFEFNSIFDVFSQEKRESVNILKSCKLIDNHQNKQEIIKIVEDDRMIQRMLINPLVKAHLNEVDFETVKELKKEIKEDIAFDIEESSKQIIFPKDNIKAAIRDFIKVISQKFSRSLDNKHIWEGTPERVVK